MDIKSLKNKILQLAIQGKLVPQNENDERVNILIKKVEDEKEQLIKSKLIKKEKVAKEISEEEKLFEIPKEWRWVRFSQVLDVRDGTHNTPKYVERGIPLITSKNINGRELDFSNVKYISLEDHLEISKRSKVDNGDILFAMIGSIGNPVIVNGNIEFSIKNVALFKYYNNNCVNNKFLYYYLLFVQDIMKQNAKGAVQTFVSLKILREYLLPLPPIEEQKRIVDKVDEIFKLIDELDNNKQDLLENISNSRNKVLQLAIRGKLVEQGEDDEPANVLLENIKQEKEQLIKEKVIKKEKSLPEITEEEKLFDIPKTWEWSRLGNIANIVMGQSPDSSSVSETIGGVEFHQGKASFGKVLIKSSGLYCTKPKKLAVSDDVLLSVRAPVGTLNITDREICIGRGLTAIRRYVDIDNKFFYYFIMALEEELVKKATGTTFKAVASTAIKEFLVPLPPLEEQKRIVAKVDLIMDYLDKLQQEIESNEIILEDIIK